MNEDEIFSRELIPVVNNLRNKGLSPTLGIYDTGNEFVCSIYFDNTVREVYSRLLLPGKDPYSIGSLIQSIDDSWSIMELELNKSVLTMTRKYHVGVINYILTH